MEIWVTLNQLCAWGFWKEFCELYGWNEWAINEGADPERLVMIKKEDFPNFFKAIALKIVNEEA